MAFQFKQFSIEDDQSAMKVGTDGVLLGAFVDTEKSQNILDIGTGSGLIAIILAQKSIAKIAAIEIDESSFKQAKYNFNKSPWAKQLTVHHTSLQTYCNETKSKFDLIVSNPPFFNKSLKSPNRNKNISKHNDSLKFDELAHGIKQLLHPSGKAYLIFPPDEAIQFLDFARIESLYCFLKLEIKPIIGKATNRLIIGLSFDHLPMQEFSLTIRNEDRSYSEEYKKLTQEFYLNF